MVLSMVAALSPYLGEGREVPYCQEEAPCRSISVEECCVSPVLWSPSLPPVTNNTCTEYDTFWMSPQKTYLVTTGIPVGTAAVVIARSQEFRECRGLSSPLVPGNQPHGISTTKISSSSDVGVSEVNSTSTTGIVVVCKIFVLIDTPIILTMSYVSM